MGWVFMRHPEFGGVTQVNDVPDVIAWHEARGWIRDEIPAELDPDALNTGLTAEDVQAAAATAEAEAEAEALKGQALEDALKDAGLSTAGHADEKRQRLAESQAAQVNNEENEE